LKVNGQTSISGITPRSANGKCQRDGTRGSQCGEPRQTCVDIAIHWTTDAAILSCQFCRVPLHHSWSGRAESRDTASVAKQNQAEQSGLWIDRNQAVQLRCDAPACQAGAQSKKVPALVPASINQSPRQREHPLCTRSSRLTVSVLTGLTFGSGPQFILEFLKSWGGFLAISREGFRPAGIRICRWAC
jgi:hypothetical protein